MANQSKGERVLRTWRADPMLLEEIDLVRGMQSRDDWLSIAAREKLLRQSGEVDPLVAWNQRHYPSRVPQPFGPDPTVAAAPAAHEHYYRPADRVGRWESGVYHEPTVCSCGAASERIV